VIDTAHRKTVLVTATNYSLYCAEGKARLQDSGVTVLENPHGRPFTHDELICRVPQIDGAIVGVDTWDASVLARAQRLRILARFGVGVDNIDLAAARRRGMVVTNARGLNSRSVAELTLALMLACLRNLPTLETLIRRGEWSRLMGRDLGGMAVGLVGFGGIGQRVAAMLRGFETRTQAFDPFPNREQAAGLGVSLVSFANLLATSDIISLHLPSIASTRHLFGESAFAAMRPGSYFVNTARGALVDEAALVRALNSGHLAGAALDVFEHEPIARDDPILACPNLILTPHTAAETHETYQKVGLETAAAVIDFFAGRTPKNQVN
jgi:D-3-phosphoglycerate dehydrogenase